MRILKAEAKTRFRLIVKTLSSTLVLFFFLKKKQKREMLSNTLINPTADIYSQKFLPSSKLSILTYPH